MIDLKALFRNGDTVTRLVYINVAVFLIVKLLSIFLQLFNISSFSLLSYLAMPASVMPFLRHVWTIITYMFLHEGIFHLFFNMLCLFCFGRIILTFLSNKQLVALYLFGGIIAGAFYLLCYNFFPYYEVLVDASLLLGASGAIMAIIVASGMLAPEMEVRLLLIGQVKLKWIAIITILISLFGITSTNAGGELAHVGGALAGYIFIVLLRNGKDVTSIFNRSINWIVNLFNKSKKKKKTNFHYTKPMNDGDFNIKKAQKNAEIDAILDKIKRSGYNSLTDQERKKLFER